MALNKDGSIASVWWKDKNGFFSQDPPVIETPNLSPIDSIPYEITKPEAVRMQIAPFPSDIFVALGKKNSL